MKRASPEADLQKTIVEYLRVAMPPPPSGPWWTAIASQPNASARQGKRRKDLGEKPGVPDLCFIFDGAVFWIELKSISGRLMVTQRAQHDLIQWAGGHVHVARSLEDVIGILRAHNVPLRAEAA